MNHILFTHTLSANWDELKLQAVLPLCYFTAFKELLGHELLSL